MRNLQRSRQGSRFTFRPAGGKGMQRSSDPEGLRHPGAQWTRGRTGGPLYLSSCYGTRGCDPRTGAACRQRHGSSRWCHRPGWGVSSVTGQTYIVIFTGSWEAGPGPSLMTLPSLPAPCSRRLFGFLSLLSSDQMVPISQHLGGASSMHLSSQHVPAALEAVRYRSRCHLSSPRAPGMW